MVGWTAGAIKAWIEITAFSTGARAPNPATGEIYGNNIKNVVIYLTAEQHLLCNIALPVFFGALGLYALMSVALQDGWISARDRVT